MKLLWILGICVGGILLVTVVYGLPATGAADAGTPLQPTQFQSESQAAMAKMMASMTAKPSGDVDVDFAEMMIPHHQGAIDMAVAELRYGRNERLRRIAQAIVVEQEQEIAAMQLAIREAGVCAAPSRKETHDMAHSEHANAKQGD